MYQIRGILTQKRQVVILACLTGLFYYVLRVKLVERFSVSSNNTFPGNININVFGGLKCLHVEYFSKRDLLWVILALCGCGDIVECKCWRWRFVSVACRLRVVVFAGQHGRLCEQRSNLLFYWPSYVTEHCTAFTITGGNEGEREREGGALQESCRPMRSAGEDWHRRAFTFHHELEFELELRSWYRP